MSDLHYFRPDWITKSNEVLDVDVCIYGGTSAGVIAAIEAVERGMTVALLQPGKFVGGLTTGGLGWTDYGKKHVIGGKAAEFYERVGRHYGKSEEWYFEPHAAQEAYDTWMAEKKITPILCQYLESVEVKDKKIASVTMMGGRKVKAKIFFDCTYEGDLYAKAGVSYHVGREANKVYNETINGIQVRNKHQFEPATLDPYVVPGDKSSGLLPFVEDVDQQARQGEGDHRVQAYCFRMCMTDDPALRVAWPKPEGYDPKQYELAARWFAFDGKSEWNDILPHSKPFDAQKMAPNKFDVFFNRTPAGHRKTDTNNHGPVSSDYIGANWGWADGCYEDRERIFQQHVTYQKGYYWFMANDERVPQRYRDCYNQWGLPNDEFKTSGHWPHTLYIREARRMISDYVATEHDCMHTVKCDDPVGMGSYALDSHNCTRFVNADGHVMNDGDVQLQPKGPYSISYRSIVPKKDQITNLMVPVCLSCSHIAYGSIRMEPVFMVLGQSAAIAAKLALDAGSAVQDVPYAALRAELDKAKQVTEIPA